MTERINEVAITLRSIFADFYKHGIVNLIFTKRRDRHSHLTGIKIMELAKWLEATYSAMNTALLSLHHNGYIVYGSNRIILKQKLLEVQTASTNN